MGKPKPLTGNHAVHTIAAAMRAFGFRVTYISNSGSRYLRMRGLQFGLRLSDHPWSGFSRSRHPDVVHSATVVGPVAPADVPLIAFEFAVRFIFYVRLRLGLVRNAAFPVIDGSESQPGLSSPDSKQTEDATA